MRASQQCTEHVGDAVCMARCSLANRTTGKSEMQKQRE